MPKNVLLLVLIGVPLVGVAGWLMSESRMTTTLDQLFEEADVLKVPHATPVLFEGGSGRPDCLMSRSRTLYFLDITSGILYSTKALALVF